MPSLMPQPMIQFIDGNGNPLAGGKVYTYEPGTTLQKDSYTDSTALSINTNPVILNAAGRANIWLDGFYKISVYDANDVLVYTTDNVSGAADAPVASAYVPWVLASAYGTITNAVSALGTVVPGMIIVDGQQTISIDTVIPVNITLVVPFKPGIYGASYPIKVNTGKILTINGSFMTFGSIQAFTLTGTGSVVFGAGSITEYNPKWFGHSTTAAPSNAQVSVPVGVRSYNTNIAAGQVVGWACSVAGAPGTWKAMPGTYA